MKFFDLVFFSVSNLKRNKMRTVLTISGVVIGIGTIVFLVSLGFGLQELVIKKIASLEALTIIDVAAGKSEAAKLNQKSVDKFKEIKGVKYVSAIYSEPAEAYLGQSKSDLVLYGVNPEYISMEETVKPDIGRNIEGKAKEIIISRAALKVFDLKDAEQIIGKEIRVDINILKNGTITKANTPEQKQKFKVVGITKEDKNAYAYTPISNLEPLKIETFSNIKVKTENREILKDIKTKISSMGYTANSMKDTVGEVNKIFNIVKIVLGAFGTVALFVASIGIFNTMTISLLERTHEIGVMKAIGGTNKAITGMFIFEAAQIGLWGGVFGLSAGCAAGLLVNAFINYLAGRFGGAGQPIFSTPIWFALMAIFFSLLVSLLAGVYPALRAGKLSPIEALRYE
ncbi:MAG: ABC transporter permease [Actinobacteria bacterium]|nr:MAG: ABC transporter permease [Actinomycetota bacterium]